MADGFNGCPADLGEVRPPREKASRIGLTATALQLDVTQEDWRSQDVRFTLIEHT